MVHRHTTLIQLGAPHVAARDLRGRHTRGGIRRCDSCPASRLALLCLLAPSGTRGVTRDKIVAYLWPESPADNARHALDQLLYAVRRQLQRDARPRSRSAPTQSSAHHLGRDHVEQLLSDGALAEAVALYRGPFLDGFFLNDTAEFERWAEDERTRLKGGPVAALQSLIRQSEEPGRIEAGIEWRRRLAALDPLDGRAALSLIRGARRLRRSTRGAATRSGSRSIRPPGARQPARSGGVGLRGAVARHPATRAARRSSRRAGTPTRAQDNAVARFAAPAPLLPAARRAWSFPASRPCWG